MQGTLSEEALCCIGKCNSGLKRGEWDQITDNVHKTLDHTTGREIFKYYLQQRGLEDNFKCVELYEACSKIKDYHCSHSSNELSLEDLVRDVSTVREKAEDLDGVPEIDFALMKRFNDAIENKSRTVLLAVLEETRIRMRDHLRRVHEGFRRYVLQSCSLSK